MAHQNDLTLAILRQPDDTTCGPTCLHAVYGFHGDHVDLQQLVTEVTPLATGGTLSAFLGLHALQRGYDATMYTYNLELFDPTWFHGDTAELTDRLAEQACVKTTGRLRIATAAYQDFLALGGHIRFAELTPQLIRSHLSAGQPILTGLSATYLYGSMRERDVAGEMEYDSVGGEPAGHFVVVHGYDAATDSVLVADPMHENVFGSHTYRVGVVRLLGAIMLGVLTYDGNLLVISPKVGKHT